MTPLIGLAGAKGSGKDTAADLLVARGYAKIAFADPLYAALSVMFGVPVAELQRPDRKEAPHAALLGHTPRRLLQTLGTEWGRTYVAPDVWIALALRRAAQLQFEGTPVVIADVRFPNEAQAILDAGGRVVRLHRQRSIYAPDAHVSEAVLPPELVSAEIYNDSTIIALEAAIDHVIPRPDHRPYQYPLPFV